jgi:hypothetical protein
VRRRETGTSVSKTAVFKKLVTGSRLQAQAHCSKPLYETRVALQGLSGLFVTVQVWVSCWVVRAPACLVTPTQLPWAIGTSSARAPGTDARHRPDHGRRGPLPTRTTDSAVSASGVWQAAWSWISALVRWSE